MKTQKDAHTLAKALVNTATGCKTTALISDMNEPLATSIGNAVEIQDVMEVLVNNKDGRLKELCLTLGAELLTETNCPQRTGCAYLSTQTFRKWCGGG